MRRNRLYDFANALSQMLISGRVKGDLEMLAQLPDGTLHIDVLSCATTHSSAGRVDLAVAAELRSWLQQRLLASGAEVSLITRVSIEATIRTDRIATNRNSIVSFDFTVSAVIVAAGRDYRSGTLAAHHWHDRVPRASAGTA